MIKGVGTDIVEIERIANLMERHGKAYLQRVFSVPEHNYLKTKQFKPQHVAGLWAAKEAVSKALGSGLRFSWHDIIISHNTLGAPQVCLVNEALNRAKRLSITQVLVSISHERDYAVAFAIATDE